MIWNRSTLENKLTHFCKHWSTVRGVRLTYGSRHHLLAAVKCMTREALQGHCMCPKAQVFASDFSITGTSLKARVLGCEVHLQGSSICVQDMCSYQSLHWREPGNEAK